MVKFYHVYLATIENIFLKPGNNDHSWGTEHYVLHVNATVLVMALNVISVSGLLLCFPGGRIFLHGTVSLSASR